MHACPADTTPPLPAGLAAAIDYIRQHLCQRIPLETLAALTGFSPARFSRVFRQHMGVSPQRYISQLRIERARELLAQGMSPAAVADACGFYDQSHFSRHFKGFCGTTPGRFATATSLRGCRSARSAAECGQPPGLPADQT
jgi:transcriptional regulator GlxA family with amidase domain